MPRKSAASMLVDTAPAERVRPDAHYDLTDDETVIWWQVVNSMPADWFNAAQQILLARFCKMVATARHIDEDLAYEQSRKRPDRKALRKVRCMQTQASIEIARLETKMRLSHQSTYCPETAARRTRESKAESGTGRVWGANENA